MWTIDLFSVFGFQSLQSNQEATELLENVRKSKEQLQTQLEKLQVQYSLDQSLWLFSSFDCFQLSDRDCESDSRAFVVEVRGSHVI